MDPRQLRYFVKVVECGNVTHASEVLHVAQPAVSRQMRNLEQDLGMQLLERSVRGVAPAARCTGTRELLRRDAETPQAPRGGRAAHAQWPASRATQSEYRSIFRHARCALRIRMPFIAHH